jgi:hypothetical protein
MKHLAVKAVPLLALSRRSVVMNSFVLTEFRFGSRLRLWGLFAVPAARRDSAPAGG